MSAACFLAGSTFAADETKPEVELAEAHGLKNWSDVEVIDFTFSVDGKKPVNRQWSWVVQDNTVTRTINGESFTIDLEAIETKEGKAVHKQFINDSFWFLFPFSIVWSNPEVTDEGAVEIEIDGEKVAANKLTAVWPSDEGYTPGDAYDLFVDEDHTVLGWIFRRGNAPEGKFFAWKDEMQAGPIRFTGGYYPEGSEKPMISMVDVRIKLAGNDEWMLPVPRP